MTVGYSALIRSDEVPGVVRAKHEDVAGWRERCVRGLPDRVGWGFYCGSRPAYRSAGNSCDDEEPWMSDLVFVALTIAVFAVLALAVRGVERLLGPDDGPVGS